MTRRPERRTQCNETTHLVNFLCDAQVRFEQNARPRSVLLHGDPCFVLMIAPAVLTAVAIALTHLEAIVGGIAVTLASAAMFQTQAVSPLNEMLQGDRDSSNSPAWWSELNSNFGAV